MPRFSSQLKSTESIRLNKYLAECGVASRRKADELIDSGLVKVNGRTVYELGVRVFPHQDHITVKGKKIIPQGNKIYVMFFKPKHVLTTMNDPQGRPTIADYFKRLPYRLFPVGRLDWDTEGLILLTNDGAFAHKIMHPQNQIPKVYLAKLNGNPSEEQLAKLKKGVSIVGGKVRALDVHRVRTKGGTRQYDWVRIAITEGKNRQVRKMFEKIGFEVKKLQRVAIGQLKLGNLKRGEHSILEPSDLKKIFTEKTKKERMVSHKKQM